ncbi:hypothetical protein SUGI_0201370 [Cryptomeria japonica]|nr:hypothetical protein SUGI_0201370 [Cryptomeria japonica]
MPCSYAFNVDERNSLLDFKQGLNFTSSFNTLQSWKGFNCYSWEGITCHPITTHVISLDLSPQSLKASTTSWPFMSWRELHGGLLQLRHLEHLDFTANAFFPCLPIPSQFHKLINLRYLSLYSSNVFGQIPKEIGNMSSLTYLDLFNNSLNGTLPTFFGKLSKLTFFGLSYNSFSGTIPTFLSKLSKLTFLGLSSNSLNDTIPKSLSKLSKLTKLHLSANSLSGMITQTFGKLSKLTYLTLRSNSLSGTIPTSLSKLSNLTYLYLYSNSLNGTILTFLGNLTKLTHLDLSDNQLIGTCTILFFDKMPNIVLLRLSGNMFTVKINVNYIPNFQLEVLHLRSLKGIFQLSFQLNIPYIHYICLKTFSEEYSRLALVFYASFLSQPLL